MITVFILRSVWGPSQSNIYWQLPVYNREIWPSGNDVTRLPDEVVKSSSETKNSSGLEAAFLAFNTAVWWSWSLVKQVGVIHRGLSSPPLHQSRRKSQEATGLSSSPSRWSASLQKSEPWSTHCFDSLLKVLWNTLVAWMTLCSARCLTQSGNTEWCTMQA